MAFITTLLVSISFTAFSVPLLVRLALRFNLVDLPGERKMHARPIPRIGGLAMVLGGVLPAVYWHWGNSFARSFLAGATVLILFAFLDDCCDLAPRWKFAGQITAASVVVLVGGLQINSLGNLFPGYQLPGWLAVPFTTFVIVGVTNAINLSDGLDGLAGGITLLILSCISYLAYLDGRKSLALIALALAGAVFGFLRYNTYPATIFMGDVGSQLLGFATITLSISLTQQASLGLSPVLPLVIHGFPILDTLTVMVGRMARGGSPFAADKSHFHHTLLKLGLHPTESVLTIYLIQVMLIALGVYFRFQSWLLLISYLTFSLLVLFGFKWALVNHWHLKRVGPVGILDDWLKRLNRTALISFLFRPLEVGLVALLAVTIFVMPKGSIYQSLVAIFIGALILYVARFQRRFLDDTLRGVLYLVVPLVCYQSTGVFLGSGGPLLPLYNLCFALLVALSILVIGLSKRSQGFRCNPTDFLVLIIVLVTSFLPECKGPACSFGVTATRIIVCFFTFEVVIAESRGELRRMTLATLTLLSMLALRGVA